VTDLEKLAHEYRSRRSFAARLAQLDPPRSSRAGAAFGQLVRNGKGPAISIGGGPLRVHPRFRNLNLAPFPNVDVVGDAHRLPFEDGTIGVVHCEAVLEHLERPEVAVAEMFRALQPGGQVFSATPFLQPFHGYPNHFRNFTLAGHIALFVGSGFEVVDNGPCVGPAFMLVDLTSNWARELLPGRILSRLAWLAIRVGGRAFVQVDRLLLRSPAAHVLASSTFVLARKPAATEV
jgi:SAM-dependent methyltransferase